jgi:hypothetical protein
MTTQTAVSIHAVDSAGGTGDLLGSGSLVAPRVVLAHRSAAVRPGDGDATDAQVRVGIARDGAVDVVDVTTVKGFSDPAGGSIIVLELARPATVAFDALPGVAGVTDANSLLAAASLHLAVIEGAVPGGGDGDSEMGLFCRLLGIGCPRLADA